MRSRRNRPAAYAGDWPGVGHVPDEVVGERRADRSLIVAHTHFAAVCRRPLSQLARFTAPAPRITLLTAVSPVGSA